MKKFYTLGFLFSYDYQQVALIRKIKPEFQKNLLNGLGGKIERYDDSPLHAMIREFKEESGVEITDWKEFCKLNNKDWEVYCYFTCGDLSLLKSMEEEQIEIIEVNNLQNETVLYNLNWLIPMALDTSDINSIVEYK